jgi:hypothetical protein
MFIDGSARPTDDESPEDVATHVYCAVEPLGQQLRNG